jgi:hypothetical protein
MSALGLLWFGVGCVAGMLTLGLLFASRPTDDYDDDPLAQERVVAKPDALRKR